MRILKRLAVCGTRSGHTFLPARIRFAEGLWLELGSKPHQAGRSYQQAAGRVSPPENAEENYVVSVRTNGEAGFDVCVVGSGPGGGIAAYVLANAGFKVALVESGKRLRAGIDYNGHGSAYAQLEERLRAGHRNPFPSLQDFSERNHFTAVGDRPGHGLFKRDLRYLNVCSAVMNMQGSLAVSSETYVDLDPERKDRNELALPRVHLRYGPNDIAMAKDMVETCVEIVEAAGGQVHSKLGKITPAELRIDYNHWVGSLRMGTDSRNSVVNTTGQAHDVRNLFIGDSSVFAAYPEKNPTLTNIALSWRMSECLAEKARKGELA